MTLDAIIASSTDLIVTTGQDLWQTIFGIFPTWLQYAIPLGIVVGVITYFLYRSSLGGGHK